MAEEVWQKNWMKETLDKTAAWLICWEFWLMELTFSKENQCILKQVTRLSETYRLSKRRLLYYIWQSTSGGHAKATFQMHQANWEATVIVSLTINTWTIKRTRDKPHRLIKWFIQNWTRSQTKPLKIKRIGGTVFFIIESYKIYHPKFKKRGHFW